MTWKAATIGMAPAQSIFFDCDIQPIDIGGKVVGYRATNKGTSIEDASLTELCRRLWATANG